MKKNLDITKPHYRELILSVPWFFIKSRFHGIAYSQLCFLMHYSTLTKKLLVNVKITASWRTNFLPMHYIKHYKQQKWTLKKMLGKQVFKNLQFQSILIVFRFVHPCLNFCICCVVNNLWMFWVIIFMFHSIW